MSEPAEVPIAELLPHGANMIVIDRLLAYDSKRSVAVVEVRRSSKFFLGGGVPAWAGIEYMAQAIAAHAGFEARLCGVPPAIGLLLGTRAYECCVAEFPLGAKLQIVVEPQFADLGLGAFKCAVEQDNEVLAHALVSTYRPGRDALARLGTRAEER
jgi:predicted hotdog family 3-hydroxylacyl-ACP dehydratase